MFRKAKVALPDLQNAYRYTFLSGKWEDAIGMKRCEFKHLIKIMDTLLLKTVR